MRRRALGYTLAKKNIQFTLGDLEWLMEIVEEAQGLSYEMEHCPACAGYITWHRCEL